MSIESEPAKIPSLYFKVGVLGAAPADFSQEFARTLKLSHFNGDEIRIAIEQSRASDGNNSPVDSRQVHESLKQQARHALHHGQNVFADMNFNTPNSRRRLPLNMAHHLGATSIAVSIVTPPKIMRARVAEWIDTDTLGLPLSQWTVDPQTAVIGTFNHLERPSEDEGIDLILTLDGSGTTEDMLGQVHTQLANFRASKEG